MSRKPPFPSSPPSGSCLRRMREMTLEVASPVAEYRVDSAASDRTPIAPVDVLSQTGLCFPSADRLDEAALSLRLWELIHHLALAGVFLARTDHLNDRELYRRLRDDLLTRPVRPDSDGTCGLDLCLSFDRDWWPFVAYYADDDLRDRLRREFPDWTLPDSQAPPFDRDRRLPKRPGDQSSANRGAGR